MDQYRMKIFEQDETFILIFFPIKKWMEMTKKTQSSIQVTFRRTKKDRSQTTNVKIEIENFENWNSMRFLILIAIE